MQSVPFPSRSGESPTRPRFNQPITVYEALFFLMLLLFVAVACTWPILAWRIHHFSTWTPDATHSYAVHEHGGTLYLSPLLGEFYVSLPWLWCSLLALTVLTGFLTGKNRSGSK
jgi:hypothetical protein